MFDIAYPLAPLAGFMMSHSEALQNASLLLGGQPRLRETRRLIEELSVAPQMTGRMKRAVDRLYELLTLEHVHDLDRAEAGFFALIDPAWPIVEEICLLADGLADAMASLDAEQAEEAGMAAAC